MKTNQKTREESLTDIGNCAFAAIKEMVDALDSEKVAAEWVKTLNRRQLAKIITDDIGDNPPKEFDSLDELREFVAEHV